MLGNHELGLSHDGKAQRHRRHVAQLFDLHQRKLRREPYTLCAQVGHSLQVKLVGNGNMRANFRSGTHFRSVEKLTKVFNHDRLICLYAFPDIEAVALLLIEHLRNGGQYRNALFGISSLLGSIGKLTRDNGLPATVICGRHVNQVGTGALRGAGACRIRSQSRNLAPTLANNGSESAAGRAFKLASVIVRKNRFLQLFSGTSTQLMQHRKAHAYAFVQVDFKRRKVKRRGSHTVDMLAHLFFGDGFGARSLHLGAFDGNACIASGYREGKQSGLPDAEFSTSANGNGRKLIVIHESSLGIAHAEHAVPLAHSTLYWEKDTTRSVGFELANGMHEVATIGPELDQIANMQLGFGVDEHQAFTHLGNTTNEHTAIIRASIAHDFIAALALQVSRGKPTRESFG